ncbi:MAG: hypothetical protein A3H45_15750 [Ignavibacteria bacterium RIFCSPLOWO2_02_FULL_55_14]|nr:MAG: hypothetical protein A3H45_15750 [Ignavibacteria bacterium RIFCSPLOWO2_02_FULL_55_14]OGU70215.1 MAG: hypothetical protein A3G43_07535 [Ignavibacteria bacterium RIFCSPLOWO2_12_FULL_56_21]HAV22962.1 MFS transporter [Bacteroidota bacterium]
MITGSSGLRPQPTLLARWSILLFLSLAMFGNYYIYDSINPVVDVFEKQLGFSNQEIGWLNSAYSVAALLTLLIGGLIVDRLGTKRSIAAFSALCLLGALLMVVEGSFTTMVIGRVILGLGAESQIVAITTAIAKWFKGKELGFAFGVNLMIARMASVAADNAPSWAGWAFYPNGPEAGPSWEGPMWIAVVTGVVCLVAAAFYWILERQAETKYELGPAAETDKIDWKNFLKFDRSFWFVVALCFTFYSGVFPFRTFAVKFFLDTHFAGVEPETARETASFFNSLLPLSAMFATPLFGLLVDRVGKRATFMMMATLLLMPVYLIMAYSDVTLWLPVSMLGISFSLIPAVMWPSVAYIVDQKRLGTAYALMTLVQQVGVFAMNLAIGTANDWGAAGPANPDGYSAGMWILSSLGCIGLAFAFLLRRVESGPNAHGLETIAVRAKSK